MDSPSRSTQCTSGWFRDKILLHCIHSPQGSTSTFSSQFNAIASKEVMVFLPVLVASCNKFACDTRLFITLFISFLDLIDFVFSILFLIILSVSSCVSVMLFYE